MTLRSLSRDLEKLKGSVEQLPAAGGARRLAYILLDEDGGDGQADNASTVTYVFTDGTRVPAGELTESERQRLLSESGPIKTLGGFNPEEV